MKNKYIKLTRSLAPFNTIKCVITPLNDFSYRERGKQTNSDITQAEQWCSCVCKENSNI